MLTKLKGNTLYKNFNFLDERTIIKHSYNYYWNIWIEIQNKGIITILIYLQNKLVFQPATVSAFHNPINATIWNKISMITFLHIMWSWYSVWSGFNVSWSHLALGSKRSELLSKLSFISQTLVIISVLLKSVNYTELYFVNYK